eukprot:TRINITY_DN52356_c0_g1_i1.p2 TRINITY_DN52356_c0_g1~~TRINITY_DN52356_c0_g1_i1.p2  ORF type:complete len:160 (-),score=23.90 TRINITY_DN52356_c0_g1_i1:7-447(-)
MAGVDAPYMVSIAEGKKTISEAPKEPGCGHRGGCVKEFAIRAAGSFVGAVLAWIALPAGLDFSLAATAILASGGAVMASVVTDPTAGVLVGQRTSRSNDRAHMRGIVKTAGLQHAPTMSSTAQWHGRSTAERGSEEVAAVVAAVVV